MSDEMILTCPIHGQVEGVIPMDGPLSNAVPTPIICPFDTVIVGYDESKESSHGK